MSLFSELKRRNVLRVAAAYGAVAWLAIQVSDLAFPRLGLPDWTVTFVIVLALIGFPLALVLAWAYQLTPGGVKRDGEATSDQTRATTRRRPVDLLIIAALALVVVLLVAERFWFDGREGKSSASSSGPAASQPTDRSLAVLPFVNMSDDPENEYFTDGLSEELINVLTQAPALRVIGRTSSFAWKGRNEDLRTVGAKLGVSHILEGSVRRQGNRVRITAQLIGATDGSHLWSQNYDRTLDDVFVIQDDIAGNVLQALEIVLDDAQRQRMQNAGVRDVEAFVAYQKGYELYTRAHESNSVAQALDAAMPFLDEAIARAPDFNAARYLAADRYIHRLGAAPGFLSHDQQVETWQNLQASLTKIYETSRDPLRKAVADVERILLSDDWRPLQGAVERALSEWGCARTQMFEAALLLSYAKGMVQFYRREVACDPQSLNAWWDLALANFSTGDRPEAFRVLDEASNSVGQQSLLTAVRAYLLLADGRIDEARAVVAQVPISQDLWGILLHSGVEAAAGRRNEALEVMNRQLPLLPEGAVDPRMLVYAAVGDRERANALAAEIDARPGGPALLVDYYVGLCACGLPFEMDAVPNLKARIAEAGVTWPPPTLIHYPLKDW